MEKLRPQKTKGQHTVGPWSCEDRAQVCLLSEPHPFPASAPPRSKTIFLHRCCHSELQGGEAQRVGTPCPELRSGKEITHCSLTAHSRAQRARHRWERAGVRQSRHLNPGVCDSSQDAPCQQCSPKMGNPRQSTHMHHHLHPGPLGTATGQPAPLLSAPAEE